MSMFPPGTGDVHRVDGETFRCGWCGQAAKWPEVTIRHFDLSGGFGLKFIETTGEVVIGVEALDQLGQPAGLLPHYCTKIPADLREQMLTRAREKGLLT